MTWPKATLEERFWSKAGRRGPDECWPWLAGTSGAGYGLFFIGGTDRLRDTAHRFAYELLIGAIPSGLSLDHLCHNADPTCPGGPACQHRRCVNPGHLEPVTHAENLRRGNNANRRKTHCKLGHPYSGDNLVINPTNGGRQCRICLNAANRRWDAKQRGH